MDLRVLRTFQTAARLLNFHRTAEKLYLAQPTVTAHIRQLEAELGHKLFERDGRRLRLTPAGERFLPRAEALLAAYDESLQDLLRWSQGYRTRLVLMASPLVARSTLPHAIKQFTAAHPDVEVEVRIGESQEIGQAVASAAVDLGISRMPPAERDTRTFILYSDPVMLVMPGDGRDPNAAPPDYAQVLQSYRLLTHNHPLYWDDLLLAIRARGLKVRTMVVTQVDIAKRFIEEGLGVSFLPESTVTRELAEGRLMEVPVPDLPLPTAATYVVLPARRPIPEATRAFLDTLRELYPAAPVRPTAPAPAGRARPRAPRGRRSE
ncbi:LysR family transcriptional regulator [Caldinitratiruptor microaerophilus]|uniref:HTH-type transcriptional regulator CitR n=1 Tax=Caldinitratiruptor microaerophilus TaxID=671077 RepID=A0AA35CPD0_9FIRM|nr:LysR family transcriptional regulator [Caldinitratiruptor microaerophilus]BDG61256.1 HTH-type transcriptional regulator CitR [Caldinitratiruptor microaerophilus]